MSVRSLVAVLGLTADDLRVALEIAAIQVDCVDEDEAAAYGLTIDRCNDLHPKLHAALEALTEDVPHEANPDGCPRCGKVHS